jgi:peptidyl-prolyl cis-trans isomerase C
VIARLMLVTGLSLVFVACQGPAPAASPAPGASTTAPTPDVSPFPDPPPDVVARVNDQPISGRFLHGIVQQTMTARQLGPEQKSRVYRETLESLIDRELLFEEALARRVKIDDHAAEQAYDKARAQAPDEAEWKASLARQGLTAESYRAEIRVVLAVRALAQQEQERVAKEGISDKEARAYFDAHPEEFKRGEAVIVRQILLKAPQDAPAATREAQRKKIEGLLERVRRGEDFAKLARQNSEDPSSAAAGGKLPEILHGSVPPSFEAAAFALKEGEVSGVVETPFGFHLIRLDQRVASRPLTFEEALPGLKRFLLDRRRTEAMQKLVKDLRAKARIEVLV